jgi:hypothetical protein
VSDWDKVKEAFGLLYDSMLREFLHDFLIIVWFWLVVWLIGYMFL